MIKKLFRLLPFLILVLLALLSLVALVAVLGWIVWLWRAEPTPFPPRCSPQLARDAFNCGEFYLNRYQGLITGLIALFAALVAGIPVWLQLRSMVRQTAAASLVFLDARRDLLTELYAAVQQICDIWPERTGTRTIRGLIPQGSLGTKRFSDEVLPKLQQVDWAYGEEIDRFRKFARRTATSEISSLLTAFEALFRRLREDLRRFVEDVTTSVKSDQGAFSPIFESSVDTLERERIGLEDLGDTIRKAIDREALRLNRRADEIMGEF